MRLGDTTAFLLDCDGTLYRGNEPIPHAAEFIGWLNAEKIPYLLLTNCPRRSPETLCDKVRKMGMDVPPERVVTSGLVAGWVLSERYGVRRAYVLGSEALRAALGRYGIASDGEAPDAVVVGHDTALTYESLRRAALLAYRGALFCATNHDHAIPSEDGPMPHTGPIAAAVAAASGRTPLFIGKPERYMLDYAAMLLDLPPDRFVMIGDRRDTDVAFARRCGIRSYLVETGMDADSPAEAQPDRRFRHLAELRAFLEASAGAFPG